MNEFTKGEAKFSYSAGRGTLCVTTAEAWICGELWSDRGMERPEAEANAELIAAAFTSATKLDALGYDALAVFRELSGIVSTFEITAREQAAPGSLVADLLARIRPEANHDEG